MRNRLKTYIIMFVCSSFVCIAQNQNTDFSQDPKDLFIKADQTLNDVYQQILKKKEANKPFITNLQKAQRLWIKFRDAEFETNFPEIKGRYDKNTLTADQANYLIKHTRERTKVLTAMLKTDSNGLIAYYPFNNNAYDESGNGLDGIVYDATFVRGIIGKAVSFNRNQYIEIPFKVNLEPSYYSLEAWVKPFDLSSNLPQAFLLKSNGGCGGGSVYGFDIIDSGKVRVEYCLPSTTYRYLISPIRLDLGEWTHVTSTYDGIALSLYLNGELVASNTIYAGPMYYTQWGGGNISLGKKNDSCYPCYYTGLLDEVRLYDRALSPSEIREQYQAARKVRNKE